MNPRKLEHQFRMIHAGIPLLYFKGMRLMMFQLSSFYCRGTANFEKAHVVLCSSHQMLCKQSFSCIKGGSLKATALRCEVECVLCHAQ